MLSFFRKSKKDEPIPFKIFMFKEAGMKPFKNMKFSELDIFQINDFTLMDFGETANIYNELSYLTSYFEVWIVPTIPNHKLSELNSFKYTKNPQIQIYLDNQIYFKLAKKMFIDDIKVNNSYLVVNKENSKIVTDKFKKLSISLRSISSDEANSIAVLKEEG